MKNELSSISSVEVRQDYAEIYDALISSETKKPKSMTMQRLRAEEECILNGTEIIGDGSIDKYCIEVGPHLVPLALPLGDTSARSMRHNVIQLCLGGLHTLSSAKKLSGVNEGDTQDCLAFKDEILFDMRDFLQKGRFQLSSETEEKRSVNFEAWSVAERFVSRIKFKLEAGVSYDDLIKQGMDPKTLDIVRKILMLKQEEFPPKDPIIY